MGTEFPPTVPELEVSRELRGVERWSELGVAIGVLLLGAAVLWFTRDIRVGRSVVVSPRLFPNIVGTGLVIAGIWYIVDVIRHPHTISGGEDSEDVDIDAPTSWTTLLFVGIGLTAFALLVKPAGFALAAGAMFTICATALGERRVWVSAVIGLALGLAVHVVFDSWLGVRLPPGLLDGILS